MGLFRTVLIPRFQNRKNFENRFASFKVFSKKVLNDHTCTIVRYNCAKDPVLLPVIAHLARSEKNTQMIIAVNDSCHGRIPTKSVF